MMTDSIYEMMHLDIFFSLSQFRTMHKTFKTTDSFFYKFPHILIELLSAIFLRKLSRLPEMFRTKFSKMDQVNYLEGSLKKI